ncbi:uncharacterized protein LOC113147031 [Cyclospora cayetanensis]|uniref:ubiquitinyl hydrolase 1 n=1 Tax=Cyclospora cayetanensis TaxID=88456 RepID=A0A6P6RVN3_9EIME|nr:uncharacterized protein LOC113147031 [Cyclospora cayetanensis]
MASSSVLRDSVPVLASAARHAQFFAALVGPHKERESANSSLQQQQQQQQQQWLPLEGTPEVLGPYLTDLGGPFQGASLLQFEYVVALEPWAFDMLQCTDTVALLFLFSVSETDTEERSLEPLPEEQLRHAEAIRQEVWFMKQARRKSPFQLTRKPRASLHLPHKDQQQAAAGNPGACNCSLYFQNCKASLTRCALSPAMRSSGPLTIANACGTVALLHCTANLPRDRFPLPPEGAATKVIWEQFIGKKAQSMGISLLAVGDVRSARSE